MARNRYNVTSEVSTSGTADTNTFPIGLITAAGFMISISEFIAAIKSAANDSRQIAEIHAVTGAITAGAAQTPRNLSAGGAASNFTASTSPTGVTVATDPPFLRLTFNGRATARWAAIDPDSEIYAQAGGGANGTLIVVNRNSAAAATGTLNELIIKE